MRYSLYRTVILLFCNQWLVRLVQVENEQWKMTYEFFYVDFKRKSLCLICNETVAVMKEYNIKIYYKVKHSSMYNSFQGHFWSEKVYQMKQKLHGQQSLFSKGTREVDISVCVSYIIAENIAKHGKPFANGEFIKEYLLSIVNVIFLHNPKQF